MRPLTLSWGHGARVHYNQPPGARGQTDSSTSRMCYWGPSRGSIYSPLGGPVTNDVLLWPPYRIDKSPQGEPVTQLCVTA